MTVRLVCLSGLASEKIAFTTLNVNSYLMPRSDPLVHCGACCCSEEINNWQWTPWAVWCHVLCARAIGLRWIPWTRYCLVLNVSSLHPSLAARTSIYRYTTQDIARWYAVIPWSAAEIKWSHASGCSKYYRALNTCSFGCTKNLDELAGTLLCGQGLNAFNGPKGIQRVSEILDILWTKSIKNMFLQDDVSIWHNKTLLKQTNYTRHYISLYYVYIYIYIKSYLEMIK